MKRTFLCWILSLTTPLAFGQGTVVFNNRVTGVVVTHVWSGCAVSLGNSPIDTPSGTATYDGFILTGTAGGPAASTTFAALLGAPGVVDQGGLVQASGGGVTTFRTGGAAGNVVPTIATFANIPPDAPVATFQMVAWDNSSGQFPTWAIAKAAWVNGQTVAGMSSPFVLTNIGGTSNSAPYLTNLTSFAWGYLECPPIIVQQPTNQTGVIDGQATFAVRVWPTYTHQTNYQWYFSNSPLAGATNSVLTFNSLQASDFGSYFVRINQSPNPWDFATSHTAQLTYALNPSLTISQVGSTSLLTFQTEAGPNYAVEYKSNLTDPTWQPLVTNNGTGGTITVPDNASNSHSRFYRVRVL